MGYFDIAEESYKACEDIFSLFFLYSNISNVEGLKNVQSIAKERGACNIEFLASYVLGNKEECLNVISRSERWPEATFFAKAYAPEEVPTYLQKWKKFISEHSKLNQSKMLSRLHISR